jgi:prepilin-type N-terminal cleavage/methylation domain-containing protein
MHQLSTQTSQTSADQKKNRSGFTLIELLVVIAIIAILASILFPVFARARENARRASCLSNLKQIGLGIMQYSQDYDERLPQLGWTSTDMQLWPDGSLSDARPWHVRIYPYIKSVQVYNCPSASKKWSGAPDTAINYGANAPLMNWASGRSLAEVSLPAQTLMIADSQGVASYFLLYDYYAVPGSDRGLSDRHLDGTVINYADGHAKWISLTRDSAGNPIHPHHYDRGVYWYPDGSG